MFETEYATASDALRTAKEVIESITNPDTRSLINRLLIILNREINTLDARVNRLQTTAPASASASTVSIPLKSLLGVPLPPVDKRQRREIEGRIPKMNKKEFQDTMKQTSRDVATQELQKRVDLIYTQFQEMPWDKIRDSFADIEILAVGRKAGLPLTEKTRVDAGLVDQIKKAAKKKTEIQAKEAAINLEVAAVPTEASTPEPVVETVKPLRK